MARFPNISPALSAQPKKQIVVHIAVAQDGTLSGTIDYPDQDSSGILITAISYKESILHFESNQGFYDGTVNKDGSEITGTWKQGGAPLSLILKRASYRLPPLSINL